LNSAGRNLSRCRLREHQPVRLRTPSAQVFNLDASLIERVKTSDLNQTAARPMQSGFILKPKPEKELDIRFHNATKAFDAEAKSLKNIKIKR